MEGKLTILAGPMRCDSFQVGEFGGLGKTSALIELARQAKAQGKAVLALQPAANTRDGKGLMSANGDWWAAMVCSHPSEALRHVAGLDVLLVDEAHLWLGQHESLAGLCRYAITEGVDVWVAGIDIDHLGQPFPWWQLLRMMTEEVRMMTAPCQCGRRAVRTFRHGLSEAAIQVENIGHYEAVCLACWRLCWGARWLRGLFRVRRQA